MMKELQLSLLPAEAADKASVELAIRKSLSIGPKTIIYPVYQKQSIDARRSPIKILLKVFVYIDEQPPQRNDYGIQEQNVQDAKPVHIIGAGPAGLFCALRCIELGRKPIVIERGKNVRDRRRDLALLNREGILNEESNYCFGEGGAGTYSDGKLYTRSNKRGNLQQVLEWFHAFGAGEQILYEAHPHIGTNKLPHIIEAMREKIIECGGEVHFESKLTDIDVAHGKIKAITLNGNLNVPVIDMVLATGHSAHDIYELLHQKNIRIESKPFALGVRVEHPQALIDQLQYHCNTRDPFLPPASYSLVQQVQGKGVFSFCMCPGGIIAPASTRQNTLVVNGWSPSKRNNPFANSGMVVGLDASDYGDTDALAGLRYQWAVEQKAFAAGGGKYVAPAQRMVDFSKGKVSATLPSNSYLPGTQSANLIDVLPPQVYRSLAEGLRLFGKKMKGYFTNEAIILATESRTSSPVRIPRDAETYRHVDILNLFPCAEGAGYAGGIVSAAMDGINIANQFGPKDL